LANILITGVAGFIGSHTAEFFLKEGHLVTGIDNFDPFYPRISKEKNLKLLLQNPNFNFHELDFNNAHLERELGKEFDGVIHLGAKAGVLPSIKNPNDYIKVNIQGTLNVLEFMNSIGCKKLIFASSSSVYGNMDIPFSESADVSTPISPYAFSKKSCELLTFNFHHLYNFDVINLRFFTVYGERQRPDLAIHKFVKAILNDEPITLYGKGDTARDYTYIADTVSGLFKAWSFLEQNTGIYENINLGNNKPISLLDLVKTIENQIGKKADIIYTDSKPGDVDITYANIQKASNILDYHPNFLFEEGISNFIKWFKDENKF